MTAAQLIKVAEARKTSSEGGYSDPYETDWKNPGLRDALLAAAGRHGRIDARLFGYWLRRHKGKIAGSLRLTNAADQHRHAAQWWVEEI